MSNENIKNKTRRQNQQSNVQKRLNERFKFDRKRTRGKLASTSSNGSLTPQLTSTQSKSEGVIVKNKTLRRSKTMQDPSSSLKRKHKFSASPQKTVSADSFSPQSEDEILTRSRIFATKRHIRKSNKTPNLTHSKTVKSVPYSQERANIVLKDRTGNRSRSNSARDITKLSEPEYVSDPEVNIKSARKRPNSVVNKYFTKGNNSYTNQQKVSTPKIDPMDDFVKQLTDINDSSYQKPERRHTTTMTSHPSGSGLLLYNSMGDIYEETETETEIEEHHMKKMKLSRPKSNPSPVVTRTLNGSIDSGINVPPPLPEQNESNQISLRLPESDKNKIKRHSSVLDATKRVFSTILNRKKGADYINYPIEDDPSTEESDLSTDIEMFDEKEEKGDIIQCKVISARKYSDHVEYEIEITYNNQEWVLYKRFKDFYDFNASLKREYKHLYKQLPTLPTRTRILNTMSSKIILERKEYFNGYLQDILKIKDLIHSNLVLYFLKVRGGDDNNKYSINIWRMGDQQLSFDSHYVLQLRFSARNIPIECDEYHGCLLKISQKEIHSDYYSSMRQIMITDFVIDNRHPRFCKTLLYNYYPTKDNTIKIELLLSDDIAAVPRGSASINIMHLLAKHKGYLYVPIVTDYTRFRFAIKHRRSLPDLNAINKSNLRADENPEFTRTPCFIIAATAIGGKIDTKIAKLTGDLNNNYSNKVIAKAALPSGLRIIPWTDDIENKLKAIISYGIDTREFRQSVKTNKQILTESNYFSTKVDDKSVREHIASVILNCWKKCLDAYSKKTNKSPLKNTLLLIISKLCNRFEFDLSHIQHWHHENVNGFKALTTFQWERIMKQYYKLFIRSLEIALHIIDINDCAPKDCVLEIIGLSAIRMSHMHHKLLPLLVNDINNIVRTSKAKRYEFLVLNYPDEETEKGFMKHSWQEDYVADIANIHNNDLMLTDPFYSAKNPSINPSAWRWFAPPDTDKNNKIQIKTTNQKQFMRNNWQFIVKFIIESLANYCRDTIYWSKVEGFPRLEQLLVQSIIWTPLNDSECVRILIFISSLMDISLMRHCIGSFGKALIRNTDIMHPTQVENCFYFLREWITRSGCDELGLLPHSFCYTDFYEASQCILSQSDWQIICVFLSFILHQSRLFKESFRQKLFRELLIKKYFRKLCCHWNRLVRKYYFMVLLYCINRSGYFHEERRKKCISDVKIEADIINTAHRCYVLFDNMTHLITKDYLINKLSKHNSVLSLSKQKLTLIDISTGNKVKYTSISQKDEEKEMEHLHSFICNMKFVEKIKNDCHLIELLNLEITQIKTKRKDIERTYRPYIDSAFNQFANLCIRYKKIQLTKKNSWVLGEVITPTIMYHVKDRDKHLNKFQKSVQDSHKFVQ